MVLRNKQEWVVDGVKTEVLKFTYDAYKLAAHKLRLYLQDPSKKYIITGHSLGGAMASLLALDATQTFEVIFENKKEQYLSLLSYNLTICLKKICTLTH